MNFLLKMGAVTTVAAVTPAETAHLNIKDGEHIIRKEADLLPFGGPALITIFNAVVLAHPEFGIREVNKFTTREVGIKRVWGLLVRLAADRKETAQAPEPVEPIPAAKKAEMQAEVSAVAQAVNIRELGAPERGVVKLKDKSVKPAKKIFTVKPGGVQAKCIELLSQPGGCPIGRFVDEMNALGKGKWTRGNTWSSLVYTLHTSKGYGLACENEVLSITGEPNA